jgi:hypothetical protein
MSKPASYIKKEFAAELEAIVAAHPGKDVAAVV